MPTFNSELEFICIHDHPGSRHIFRRIIPKGSAINRWAQGISVTVQSLGRTKKGKPIPVELYLETVACNHSASEYSSVFFSSDQAIWIHYFRNKYPQFLPNGADRVEMLCCAGPAKDWDAQDEYAFVRFRDEHLTWHIPYIFLWPRWHKWFVSYCSQQMQAFATC
jgi:hypothetical protein